MITKKCVICDKKLTKEQNKMKKRVCSKKCDEKYKRIYESFHYLTFKPKYQNFMRKYYKENREKLKFDSKMNNLTKKTPNKSYNRPEKNRIRDKIIELVNLYKINKILTLESKDFLFSKEFPNNKIYVYEINKFNYEKMLKTKPRNVSLFYGDIAEFNDLDIDVDLIYLDFCSTLTSNIETLSRLKERISKVKIFAITICPRNDLEIEGDYQFNILKRIYEITQINWKPIYAQGYADKGHTGMFTCILENPK